MRSTSGPPSSYAEEIPLRRRVGGLALAIAANLLLLILLLELSPTLSPPKPEVRTTTFQLEPDVRVGTNRARQDKPVKRAGGGAQAREPNPVTPPATPPVPPPVTPPVPLQLIPLTREEMAAADVSNIRSSRAGPQLAGSGASSGTDSGAASGEGSGPGGERLYNAEWYREPTNAELGGYLPNGAPDGAWALIACRTVERFHVDDCRELGDSPAGSGLARAMRQAAWQFLVRPPRVGGRPQVGAWVRIRISFNTRGVSVGG